MKHGIWDALLDAHAAGAYRQCSSTRVLTESFLSNGYDSVKSVTVASMCLGGKHAPVLEIGEFWIEMVKSFDKHKSCVPFLADHLRKNNIIPGYGSSFVKGGPDPILGSLDDAVAKIPNLSYMFNELSDSVSEYKNVHPNLGLYTVVLLGWCGVPLELMPSKVVELRIPAWNRILTEIVNETRNKR